MDELNATYSGDYLWTNTLMGEVFPTATTPGTWSVWQDCFDLLKLGDIPTIELIAGRPYLNYSLMYSFAIKLMRTHERVMNFTRDSIGIPPTGVDIPPFPISWRTLLLKVLPREARNEMTKTRIRKGAPEFLAKVRGWCWDMKRQIESVSADEVITLWTAEIRPVWKNIHPLQDKMNEELHLVTNNLKAELVRLLGDEQANALLTTVSSTGELASVGPLLGLSKLRNGELSREEFIRQYGHRSTHENELAEPRPYDDARWLDGQMAKFSESPTDVADLFARRDAEFTALWGNIKTKLSPNQAGAIERKIKAMIVANTLREETRSELTRIVDVIRALFLRAGDLTGLGDGVFFLTVGELIAVLSGDASPAAHISTRRETYEKYKALPPLPSWIRGRFDPFQWATDPNRRRDLFNAHGPGSLPKPGVGNIIRGQPGSAGRVEGTVRRLDSPGEGDRLQPGEVLVTSTTNVGWTPLFPRAAAVVTDLGGSLSHAAIVARELGIPAVVGCGEATIRLHTGDRVRIDGGQGMVEILGN